ncbi:MAG: SpoIIE family protein phosphatase, partial [Clostridia bacterium]|nr:SpoIIE family protein phosphatase [Clostridia bacterium]
GGLCQTLALLSEDLSCVDGAGSFSASYKNISKAFLGVLEGITSQYREDEKRTVAVRDKLRELGFDALETVVCGERASRIFISGLSPVPDRKRLLYLQKQLGRTLDCSLSLPTLSLDESGCLLYAERAHCFDVRAGVAMESCEGISGDTVRVFEDSGNHYSYVLICDGMGSGQEAALTSGVSAKMLERLLVSGVPVEEALGMLNGLLSFGRSSDAEISTTVDLLCLDKLTGRAVFLKSGASPTYVKRGTNIFKLTGASMPMGILSLVDVKRLEFDTCDGDMIVQSSDGVTAGESECLWLLEYLNETDESDPERMAEHIKREAVQKGSVDDVSVVVTKIHQKF